MALHPTIAALTLLWTGVVVSAFGLSGFGKSTPIAWITVGGGCTIIILGTIPIVVLDPGGFAWDMAFPAAGFFCFLLAKYGPSFHGSTLLKITVSLIQALCVAIFLAQTNWRLETMFIIPAFAFWFPLAKYVPMSGWRTWLRRCAYVSMVVYAVVACVAAQRSLALTKQGCFCEMSLLGFYTLRLPHPYDFWVMYRLVNVLFAGTLILILLCSVTCLCLWRHDHQRVDASAANRAAPHKPLNN